MKVLISGGGTGGHIFPAVSIANALRAIDPSCDILFVGALGRMEMERVPQAGYPIIGLPVRGIDRRKIWRNVGVAIDFIRSMRQVRKIIREFRPDVGVGVGGGVGEIVVFHRIVQGNDSLVRAARHRDLLVFIAGGQHGDLRHGHDGGVGRGGGVEGVKYAVKSIRHHNERVGARVLLPAGAQHTK